jgi:uncharacterized protein (DUF302 family)
MKLPEHSSPSFPARVVTVKSEHDFAATAARLTRVLTEAGLTIFADIDQADAAAKAGTTLRPTRLILFGNPKGGTPVMQMNPHAALELPLKAVVWEDDDRSVHIDFLDVSGMLINDYHLPVELAGPLAKAGALIQRAAASM